ncbi:hypothetical protein G7072_08125 [Nocardioides sp. HDW12B]|uniref:hypothetical protein n=1 Tax=Nocardioides sp. HDW12B TaxID=2714939 RepID=UPI00140C9D04|nr:hypothetical protein [Nocardioides sp. HDW12B]QIK66324.1 hypothetical protein G7072_08125 [Nocardioides sp. HDW12B]
MPLFHLRHTWVLVSAPGGNPRRRCARCGKTQTWVDQSAVNEAKGRYGSDGREGFGGPGAMVG